MKQLQDQNSFSHQQPSCTGILITNLGTPEAPTAPAVRRYLAEFLSDPRVVEAPRWLWKLVLHGIILRIRPPKVAKAYASVWTENGAPLLSLSQRLAEKLQNACSERFPGPVRVVLAMRYGTPSIRAGLEALRKANAQRILVLPLYPQYSATTTATTFDAVCKVLQTWRWMPEVRMVNNYHDHSAYIQALADSIRTSMEKNGVPDKLLFSFHGLPKRYHLAGDPYYHHCQETAKQVASKLKLDDEQWFVGFQSRFGREEWLKPYTDHTLMEWGQAGIGHVQVISPGFAVDCLETLEELAVQNRDFFLNAGGVKYYYIPALNEQTSHVAMLTELISQHVQGWPETSKDK